MSAPYNKALHQTRRGGAAASRPVVEARLAGEGWCWTGQERRLRLRPALLCVVLWLCLFVEPKTASACVCLYPWPTFEETAATSDAAVIGLVVGRGGRDGRPSPSIPHAAYVDIEVLESIKGLKRGTSLRVWNTSFETDCSIGISSPLASVLAVALQRNHPKYYQNWNLLRLSVEKDDYFFSGACAEYTREVASMKEGTSLAEAVRARLRRGKR